MGRSSSLVVALVAMLVAGLTITAWSSPALAAQQSQADVQLETLMEFTLDDSELPPVGASIRLLQITLAPGAKSPLHTHPGVEMQLIESGTFRTIAEGNALLFPRADDQATPTAGPVQPPDGEFIMRAGESIAFLPGTAMTFRNPGSKDAVMLVAVIQPWGNQAPPGITYIGKAPTDEDFVGVTSLIFGDGFAPELPPGQAVVRVERMTLEAGVPLPETTVPTLLSLEKGSFGFNVDDGSVQVSRTANPGLQPEAAAGTAFSLNQGDAAFFAFGNAAADRADDQGDVTFLRLTITPTDEAEAATPASDEQARITVTAPPAPTPTPEPTVTPTPEPSASTEIAEGATVVSTEDEVNLRSGPSTTSDIVGQVNKGQVLTVTGPSQEGENHVWWPVQDVNDPSIAGFIASEFIEIQP